ncbi:MAG: ABC transporter ATP-binding protein [Ruminococcus sp.]|nr:ABC transporter ATP-binding protein [Ruminococcus sp.]
MIEVQNITKHFQNFTALENVSCSIDSGCIYGMVGSNGAGKSTLLRVLAGVYQADSGSVLVDGQPVWDNPNVKKQIAYVPDELYFLSGNLNRMKQMHLALYNDFDSSRFDTLCKKLELPQNKSIGQFSKGMHRQAATILTLSRRPNYLLFDETFDGLDPVMRQFVKSLICDDVLERGATAIITSHSLRELEDLCNQLALLHKGGLVLESDIENLKTSQFKIQIAFSSPFDKEKFSGIKIVHFEKSGSVANLIVNGDRQEIVEKLRAMSPILLDVLPLTLEEVFTYEMEALGYSFGELDTEQKEEKPDENKR